MLIINHYDNPKREGSFQEKVLKNSIRIKTGKHRYMCDLHVTNSCTMATIPEANQKENKNIKVYEKQPSKIYQ